MNWEAAGAIGEIIGALAVFFTLAYLAVQIRQNTKTVHSAALDSSIQAASAVRNLLSADDDAAEIYRLGSLNPHDLSDTQLIRYRMIITNVLWALWNLFSQSKNADLSKSVWECQIPVVRRVLNCPGGQWYWQEFEIEFEDSFRDEVNRIMATEN
jgi:hypothetical protein